MNINKTVVLASLQDLIGMKPWNIALGHGSFLTLEFGQPITTHFKGKSHIHGEWHLWLRCCAWRVVRREHFLVASDDEPKVASRAIQRLRLDSLTELNVDPNTLDLRMVFGDMQLATFSVHSHRYEQWQFFKPDGRVITAKAGGVLVEQSGGNFTPQ